MHCYVRPKSDAQGFDCVFVHAFNERGKRDALWEELRNLALRIDGPWVICGYFNCVLNCDERVGALVRL